MVVSQAKLLSLFVAKLQNRGLASGVKRTIRVLILLGRQIIPYKPALTQKLTRDETVNQPFSRPKVNASSSARWGVAPSVIFPKPTFYRWYY